MSLGTVCFQMGTGKPPGSKVLPLSRMAPVLSVEACALGEAPSLTGEVEMSFPLGITVSSFRMRLLDQAAVETQVFQKSVTIPKYYSPLVKPLYYGRGSGESWCLVDRLGGPEGGSGKVQTQGLEGRSRPIGCFPSINTKLMAVG